MPTSNIREEVINVILADLLSDRGFLSIPESIRRTARRRSRRLPDVTLADFWGVRITIEGRIDSSTSIKDGLFRDASKRVEEGISPICLAVLYPRDLRNISSLNDLRTRLSRSSLTVRIICENDPGQWTETDIQGITDMLRRSYDLLVDEDIVASSVNDLDLVIGNASDILINYPSGINRLESVLGISRPRRIDSSHALKMCRIGSLTLVNAMIFHQVVAAQEPRIISLARVVADDNTAEVMARSWRFIVTEVDYVPVFKVALDILTEFQGFAGFNDVLRILAESALRITGNRAALRHDLMGRIYHRLLSDAKYFGAFYTQVSSATLLLKMALDPEVCSNIEWCNIESFNNLRIADLASGTGTLLKAALQTIVDNHVRNCVERGITPDLHGLHRILVEQVIWGFDVVPFAIHLAASALAIHEPDAFFTKMHLYTLPLESGIGRRKPKLGSLAFLDTRIIRFQANLFGGQSGPSQIAGSGESVERAEVPELDLCVMNPPFTRSVGGNLLFGNLPDDQRSKLQTELKRIIRSNDVKANITAGLGSPFAALGDSFVKSGGQMALILPRALLSGEAWQVTRQLIGTNYHLRYIIVSHESGNWNFSENTSLSECMIIAKKLERGEIATDTKVVNLWIKPKTSIESLGYAEVIKKSQPAALNGTGICEIRVGNRKIGEMLFAEKGRISQGTWHEEQAFSQTELNRTAHYLKYGKIYIPGRGIIGELPVTNLSTLGDVGPDRRDIHDGFSITSSRTAYPAFWGHNSETVQSISQQPNQFLSPLSQAHTGRNLRDPHLLWSRSGKLLIAERIRVNNVKILSTYLNESVLSNTWWPVKTNSDDDGKLIALWLNSTFGILSMISARVETEGSWIEIKKPMLSSFQVPNTELLNTNYKERMLQHWNEISSLNFKKLAEITSDDSRKALDRIILEGLGLNTDLEILRQLLFDEPLLKGA